MLGITTISVWETVSERGVTQIDLFPGNMPVITTLVESVRERLTVVADYCAYGSYSSPQAYVLYRTAIENQAAQGRQVHLTIYNDATSRRMASIEFGLADPDDTVNQKAFEEMRGSDKFKTYLSAHRGVPPPTTYLEFLDMTQKDETDCIVAVRQKGAQVQTTLDQPLSVFRWIKDYKEAIVSIPNFGSIREASLMTRSTSFVRLLGELDQSR
jgi:hypothetical protein